MIGAIIGGVASIAGGLFGASAARKRERAAARERARLQGKLNSLEANTLDTLRATGASAGGATALANAALRSKKGVAASIEMQEKQNEDKRAAGEKQKQDALMQEGQRVQQGEAWEFGQRESREMQQLDRTASMLGASRQAEAQAASDKTGAITGMFGSLAGIAGGMAGGQ